MGDASLGLLPDFVGGPVIMSLPVGFVGILVCVKIFIGMFGGQFSRHANGSVGTVTRIGIKNVGAVTLQNLLALARNIFRHAQSDRESFGRAEHRIGNAGIAAGGIEKNLSGAQLSAPPSLGDNVARGTVFDRAAGIVPLSLTQKCYTRQAGGEGVQAQQGSVADALDQTVAQRFAQS